MSSAAHGSDIVDEDQLFGPPPSQPAAVSTQALITAMLDSGKGISDLIFSPGRPPQVERHGELVAAATDRLSQLRPEDTRAVARGVINGNFQGLRALREQGACDVSYSIPDCARFRVNVFRQRGSYAIVMRLIATRIPTFADLGLPGSLDDVAGLKNGLVLVNVFKPL